MATVNLSLLAGAGWQFFTNSGTPLAGGLLYTYLAGTTTPAPTYTTYTGVTANANPIVLDSAGRPPNEVWNDTSLSYKFVLKTSTGVTIGTYDNLFDAVSAVKTALANTSDVAQGDALVGFRQSYYSTGLAANVNAAGATGRTVNDKLQEWVSVRDFGAVCDGSADDTVAVQRAIDFCAAFANWPALLIPGKCKITASLIINRQVDGQTSEFQIIGEGAGAGFYLPTGVTLFDSTITMSTASPVSEFITFVGIRFEGASVFNASFVLSKKFLRIKFINCFFYIIRCQLSSDSFAQTLYFIGCNIRNNPASFIDMQGMYDISFDSCIMENGNTIVRSVSLTRGASGVRFINNVIEGIQSSVVIVTGAAGFDLIGNHIESNFSPEFNFFAGVIPNGSATVIGNYIYNPNGATFYYGPMTAVFSAGNNVTPSVLHSNAVQITNLISNGDNCAGGVSDATNYSTVNGSYRAGNAVAAWTDSGNQITKDTAGNFGLGVAALATTRLTVKGADQTATNYAGAFLDSAGLTIALFRNDRLISMPVLQNYANDAAAAAGGIPVGYLYRNASVVQVRVT